MIKFNSFIASGVIASLLSSISCTGAFADLETGVNNGENSPYMYINKNSEKDKKEKEENLEDENSGSNMGAIIGGIAGATLLAGGIGFGIYKNVHKASRPIAPSISYNPEPVVLSFYTFDIGKDDSQPYELLDSSYNVLKRFKSRDERDKYLEEYGVIVTRAIPDYAELEKLRAEVK